jgi:multidrug transporter EmrE-like cation transporter
MKLTDSQLTGFYLTITELIGDISLKTYAQKGGMAALAIGTAAYLGLEAIMIEKLKYNSLAIVNGYWDGMSTIATTIAAMFMGETLTSVQLGGLGLLSSGLFMLEWGSKENFALRAKGR